MPSGFGTPMELSKLCYYKVRSNHLNVPNILAQLTGHVIKLSTRMIDNVMVFCVLCMKLDEESS